MDRRRFLTTSLAAPFLFGLGTGRSEKREPAMWDDTSEGKKWHAEAMAAFPYEHLQVPGGEALREWERLKSAGRGTPVVVGDDEAFANILDVFHPDAWRHAREPVLAEVLAKADRLRHPEDLIALRRSEGNFLPEGVDAESLADLDFAKLPEDQRKYAELMYYTTHPPIGDWPQPESRPVPAPGLAVARDLMSGQLYDRVHIVLLPTDDPAAIPAYLRWGGWNENPPSEYHVAALRSWGERYGAELIGLGPDTMNIRVASRTQSREGAVALAREQYTLCFDIIDQGFESLSALGAALTTNDWWFLWWD